MDSDTLGKLSAFVDANTKVMVASAAVIALLDEKFTNLEQDRNRLLMALKDLVRAISHRSNEAEPDDVLTIALEDASHAIEQSEVV